MLAQLSERAELNQVCTDLFGRTGCSIETETGRTVRPARGHQLRRDLATASLQGHSAVGYRLAGSGEVIVNPAKSAVLRLALEDEVLVLAPGI